MRQADDAAGTAREGLETFGYGWVYIDITSRSSVGRRRRGATAARIAVRSICGRVDACAGLFAQTSRRWSCVVLATSHCLFGCDSVGSSLDLTPCPTADADKPTCDVVGSIDEPVALLLRGRLPGCSDRRGVLRVV